MRVPIHNAIWNGPTVQVDDTIRRLFDREGYVAVRENTWKPIGDTIWDQVGVHILDEVLIIRQISLNVMRFLNIKYNAQIIIPGKNG